MNIPAKKNLCPPTVLVALLVILASCSSVPTFDPQNLSGAVRIADQGGWIVVSPSAGAPNATGLLYYPGGLVKPEAYLEALAPLAEAGYPVVVVKMPFDLAFFDSEKGLTAMTSVPTVTKWVIGGHSLGGVAAAMAVAKHPETFAGLIFWASYPAGDTNLSRTSVPALSISATNDGLSTPTKVAAAAPNLPPGTIKVVIEGGNHAQFGTYGPQKNDGLPTISRDDQQRQANAAVLEFLGRL